MMQQVVGGTKALKGKVNFNRNTNKGYDVRKFKYNKRIKEVLIRIPN